MVWRKLPTTLDTTYRFLVFCYNLTLHLLQYILTIQTIITICSLLNLQSTGQLTRIAGGDGFSISDLPENLDDWHL